MQEKNIYYSIFLGNRMGIFITFTYTAILNGSSETDLEHYKQKTLYNI